MKNSYQSKPKIVGFYMDLSCQSSVARQLRSINVISIPFDVSFHFNEQLRDIPNAPDEMQRAIEFLQTQLDEVKNNLHQQVYLYGLIGVYARMLGDFSLAYTALIRAIALSEELNDERLKMVNQLRLAHLYHWQQDYEQSDRLFRKLLVRCISNSALESYLDFVYQHFGKSYFDRGEYTKAQKYFEEALAIRSRKGDRSLIESSQLVIEVTQRHISSDSLTQTYRKLG